MDIEFIEGQHLFETKVPESELIFFLEKASFFITKGESEFCIINLPIEKQLIERKIELEKSTKTVESDRELFDIITKLNHFASFKEIIKSKISILLNIQIGALAHGNRFEVSAPILKKIIESHELVYKGIFETGFTRNYSNETKLEIYSNFTDEHNKKFEIACAIWVTHEEFNEMFNINRFTKNKESFIEILQLKGNFYVEDLLSEEIMIKKVIPKFVTEIYHASQKCSRENWQTNANKICNLSNYYIGLG